MQQNINKPTKRKKTKSKIMAAYLKESPGIGKSRWFFKSVIKLTKEQYKKLAKFPEENDYRNIQMYIKDDELERRGFKGEYRLSDLLYSIDVYLKTNNDRLLCVDTDCFVAEGDLMTLDEYTGWFHGMTFEDLTNCF